MRMKLGGAVECVIFYCHEKSTHRDIAYNVVQMLHTHFVVLEDVEIYQIQEKIQEKTCYI